MCSLCGRRGHQSPGLDLRTSSSFLSPRDGGGVMRVGATGNAALSNNPDRVESVAGLCRYVGLLPCIGILCPAALIRPHTGLTGLSVKVHCYIFFVLLGFMSSYSPYSLFSTKPETIPRAPASTRLPRRPLTFLIRSSPWTRRHA